MKKRTLLFLSSIAIASAFAMPAYAASAQDVNRAVTVKPPTPAPTLAAAKADKKEPKKAKKAKKPQAKEDAKAKKVGGDTFRLKAVKINT
ncbi:MAG: hypothetical protein PHD04_02830 [Candidatus Pacebacteria bacterium]|nr:hypothetical protein [Candidatus Paceibacterota bacterium]